MPSTFAFVDGYEAVAHLPDGTVRKITRGSLALRGWERALWEDATGKSNRGDLSTELIEKLGRIFQSKELPTSYDDVVQDEKARVEAVLTILRLRQAQLAGNHPSPAASAIAQINEQLQSKGPNTELDEFQEKHFLAGANHPAAHPKLLLRETTLVPRTTQPESTPQCAVPKESATKGFILTPSRDDRTMRSLNPKFWPVSAADLGFNAGYTAMNVGGNYLYLVEPDVVLFMENGVKMPWPSHQMQGRAELLLQWYFAHEWKTLTAIQAEELTESLRIWPPSVPISYLDATVYMCWWLKSVAYLYKLLGESDNFKIARGFVIEFDKESPAISIAVVESWTRIMGDVLDLDLKPRTGICGEISIATVDGAQVCDEVGDGVETSLSTTAQQVASQVQREGLHASQHNDSRKPGAPEVTPVEATQAGIHHSGVQIMKQPKRRSKQKQRLRLLARTNFISTSANRKSKKLSLDLRSTFKPKGKIFVRRARVARRLLRSNARATMEAMEKPARKLAGTTTRKQDRDLKEAMRISLIAVSEQNNTVTAPVPHPRQAWTSGPDTLERGQEEHMNHDESTEKVSWLKAQEMYPSEKYDPDIRHAIHEEILSTETADEDYHDGSD